MRKKWLGMAVLACAASVAAQAQTYVTPMMGGGQTAADMAHIDIFYDQASNLMFATVDESVGTPTLRPLPAGYAFDASQPYAVLHGKAYNSQYGWNAGGQFAIPPGASIWIELINCSPGLETYSGTGRLAAYEPIFGTCASPRLWKWSGVMAHNTYALTRAAIPFQFASYHIYFGDAQTGARGAYASYGDTTVVLTWNADLPSPSVMLFGAQDQTNGAPLSFVNGAEFVTNSQAVLTLHRTNDGPFGLQYAGPFQAVAIPATALNGGPQPNHAASGSRLALHLVSLSGPGQGSLEFWEPGEDQSRLKMSTGETAGTNCVLLTEDRPRQDSDPYGAVQGRQVSVTQPGLYCLGFRVVDTSTNGSGGKPVHIPSPTYHVYFQAEFTISTIAVKGGSATLTFAGESGKQFYLERSTGLGAAANWQPVTGALPGTNALQTLTDPAPPPGSVFFRIRSN